MVVGGLVENGESFLISSPDALEMKNYHFSFTCRTILRPSETEQKGNLASASLPGGGFRTISTTKVLAEIHSEKEAVLLGKVPDPWMTHYVEHISYICTYLSICNCT